MKVLTISQDDNGIVSFNLAGAGDKLWAIGAMELMQRMIVMEGLQERQKQMAAEAAAVAEAAEAARINSEIALAQ